MLTSYLVANAMVMPLSGWLIACFGRKRYYMGCVTLFTVTSALCGLAASLPMLIFFGVSRGWPAAASARRRRPSCWTPFPPQRRAWRMAVYGVAVVDGAGPRANARRLDHRQLLLALDLLYQHSRGLAFALS